MSIYKITDPLTRGDDVALLQHLLMDVGYDCGDAGADGIWGRDSDAALAKYKAAKGLAGGNAETYLIDVDKASKSSKILTFPITKIEERVSPNFRLREFFSPTGVQTHPKVTAAMVAKVKEVKVCTALVKLLEGLRAHVRQTYPDAVIVIRPRGGYRPDAINKAVGGADGSQHRYGRAVDFSVVANSKKMDAATLAIITEGYMWRNGYKGGVGVYNANDDYIHVDTRGAFTAWFDTYKSTGTPSASGGKTQGGRPCVIKSGIRCAGAAIIQRFLGTKVTGYFKAADATALKAWQSANGLAADGAYGTESNKVAKLFDW